MSFTIPARPGPAEIADRLLRLPEFEHLRAGEARVVYLMRVDPVIKAGRQVLGTCYLPTVQGSLKPLFDWLLADRFGNDPPIDFLIVLDTEYWQPASELKGEILVYHELMHCGQAVDKHGADRFDPVTGQPIWCIRGHDVEEFVAVVERYGQHNDDIRRFVAAAKGE